jgi:hypothetical protein
MFLLCSPNKVSPRAAAFPSFGGRQIAQHQQSRADDQNRYEKRLGVNGGVKPGQLAAL